MLRDHCDLYNAALQERRDAYRMRGTSIRYGMQSGQLKDIRNADPLGQGAGRSPPQQTLPPGQSLRRVLLPHQEGRETRTRIPLFPAIRTPPPIDGDGGVVNSTVRVQGVGCIRCEAAPPVRGTVKRVLGYPPGQAAGTSTSSASMFQSNPSRSQMPLSGPGSRCRTSGCRQRFGRFVDNIRPLRAAQTGLPLVQRNLARKSEDRTEGVRPSSSGSPAPQSQRRSERPLAQGRSVLRQRLRPDRCRKPQVRNMTSSASGTADEPGNERRPKIRPQPEHPRRGLGVLSWIRQKRKKLLSKSLK